MNGGEWIPMVGEELIRMTIGTQRQLLLVAPLSLRLG